MKMNFNNEYMILEPWMIYQSKTYVNNITMGSYIYCCLYYFYYGKVFNGITNFRPLFDIEYDVYFYMLDKEYDIVNSTEDAIRLRKRLNEPNLFRYSLINKIRDIYNRLPIMPLTLNIKDIPDCIKEFAVKYEKELYWW